MNLSASPWRSLVALALTWAAGFVDALGYLLLNGIYAGNMSGNTVLIGVHAVDGDWRSASLHAATVGAFLVGLTLGGIAIRLLMNRGLRRVLAVAMALELACLATLLFEGGALLPGEGRPSGAGREIYLLIAAAAAAMGIQNTSLRMADVLTVYTTHVTGAVTRFSEDAIDFILGNRKETDAAGGRPKGKTHLRGALFAFGLWAAFLLGATAAAYATARLGAGALAIPMAVILLVGIADAAAPLARTDPE